MFQSEEILFWEEKLLNEEIIVFSKICGLGKSSILILNAGSKRQIAYGSSYRAEVHISQKISFFFCGSFSIWGVGIVELLSELHLKYMSSVVLHNLPSILCFDF